MILLVSILAGLAVSDWICPWLYPEYDAVLLLKGGKLPLGR